jgi:hypothetical protein
MSAKIVLKNKAGYRFENLPFDIYCDGKIIGTMHRHTTINFDKAGVYTLQAKLKYWQTPVMIVKIEEGQILNLKIISTNKYLSKSYILIWLTLSSFFLVNHFFKAEWLPIFEIILFSLFIVYGAYYLIFRRKSMFVIKDDDEAPLNPSTEENKF